MSQSDEFEAISETQLIDLISSDDLETESGDEEEVFRAVMKCSNISLQTHEHRIRISATMRITPKPSSFYRDFQ